ncbi:DNA recombination protein RmuC [Pseudomonas massiliensis]|uniref:DNA recombination protein RmuC n=1 Tax=Pseudomonas massiliensis TaxID=522492 RepID=UPI00058FFE74|nr:DNA recombination protein RmuC [Pseudomonas massiliensis]
MQATQWPIDVVIITAVLASICALLGYFVANARQARRSSQLAIQLGQAQAEQTETAAQLLALKVEIKAAENHSHQLQIAAGGFNATLASAEATQARLAAEVNEGKQRQAALETKLEASNTQRHEAVTLHEAVLAESRSLKLQLDDYKSRLGQACTQLEEARGAIGMLKDALAEEGKRAKGLEAADSTVRAHLDELKAQLAAAVEKYEALQRQLAESSRERTRLQTELDERAASHVRELAAFEQQKASLSEQFKLLSTEILEAKTLSLQESSKVTLSAVMSPFQQSIDTFKREVQEIHHRETTQQGELRKELESLKALNQQITAEAHELSTALRGQKKLQGNWGELILENVLERSGLQLGKDYRREVSIMTDDGAQRPDAIVYLPQNKHLIIDAKVSLNAYTRFVNSTDDNERALALREHVQAVASRIKELADRDYYKLPGLRSPDMVFMFIPIESAFVEALKADETLFQQAIENNVLVATPTTLLTSLNIVRQLWRYEDQNKHTAALADKAETVFKKLNTFLGSFERIKKGLEVATEAYGKAEGQLISGKGNLVKQVGEFKNLAPAIKAELPAYFVEKAALEIDFIPMEQAPEAEPLSFLEDRLSDRGESEISYQAV